MNWFHAFFVKMIDEKSWLYNLDFFSDIFLFLAISMCIVSIASKSMNIKHYVISTTLGIMIFVVDKTLEIPTSTEVNFPAIDTIIYLSAIIIGILGMMIILIIKKTRSIESIAFTSSLLVMSSLIFSYHLLIINGGLKTAVENNERFYLKVISGSESVFDFFCEDKELKCLSGRISSLPKHFKELPVDFVNAYKDMATKKSEPVFMLSNVATTATIQYTSVFAQRGARYRLIYDTKNSVRLFHSQKIQFMTLANSAVLFWFFMPCFVVYVHKKRFFKVKNEVVNASIKQ